VYFWSAITSVFTSEQQLQSRQELDEQLAMQKAELDRMTKSFMRKSSLLQQSFI